MMSTYLTASAVRSALEYSRLTGVFVWRCTKRTDLIGRVAGIVERGGVRIQIGPHSYLAHRLAWLYVYGRWPSKGLDHIDGDNLNNALHNLREATCAENAQNQRRAKTHNKSGLLGVRSKPRGKFEARITVDKKVMYLGLFDAADEAHAAYINAKRLVHPFGVVAQ